MKPKAANYSVPAKWVLLLCVMCFFVGTLYTNRMWRYGEEGDVIRAPTSTLDHHLKVVSEEHCNPKSKPVSTDRDILDEVSKTHRAVSSLDKTISALEMELAGARAVAAASGKQNALYGAPALGNPPGNESSSAARPAKAFVVIGINTAFSSRKRRDSVRETWMPTGEKRLKLEREKGIVIRFVIGHSATPGGILDKGIDAEDAEHGDFLRLDHTEGYHELSSKTKIYFSTAVSKWDADFYVKVDDDVHVNLGEFRMSDAYEEINHAGMLVSTLARFKTTPRVYVGCMKSGPVLAQKGVKYHEPEYWKFGEDGNRYFRHATGQLYAISKDLATYISINQPILHRYANEDVSLGSWFIGLDVNHIDERSFCCGTPPDCEWKAQAGNACVASFDWTCSGICKSVERLKSVHRRCGEGDDAVFNAIL